MTFFLFPVWFRYVQSTTNRLTVVFYLITSAFNSSWATRDVALDIAKAFFSKVLHTTLLH